MYPVIILHVISQDNMIKGNSRMFLETRMIHGIRRLCIYVNNVSGIRPNAVVEFLDANSVIFLFFKTIHWLTNNFEANYKYVTKSSALMVIITTNERVMVFLRKRKER